VSSARSSVRWALLRWSIADGWRDWSRGYAWHELGLRWLPVPAGGDLCCGPLVFALRPVLPRRLEELLAERGVTVDHVTIYRWVQRFTPEFIEAARPCRHAPGSRWFADETYLKVAGKWAYLYRAVDQHGQVIDVLLSARRDLAAARRFFTRALRAGTVPAEVTTDRAPVYPWCLTSWSPRPCTP
jgi:transposase-like protein